MHSQGKVRGAPSPLRSQGRPIMRVPSIESSFPAPWTPEHHLATFDSNQDLGSSSRSKRTTAPSRRMSAANSSPALGVIMDLQQKPHRAPCPIRSQSESSAEIPNVTKQLPNPGSSPSKPQIMINSNQNVSSPATAGRSLPTKTRIADAANSPTLGAVANSQDKARDVTNPLRSQGKPIMRVPSIGKPVSAPRTLPSEHQLTTIHSNHVIKSASSAGRPVPPPERVAAATTSPAFGAVMNLQHEAHGAPSLSHQKGESLFGKQQPPLPRSSPIVPQLATRNSNNDQNFVLKTTGRASSPSGRNAAA